MLGPELYPLMQLVSNYGYVLKIEEQVVAAMKDGRVYVVQIDEKGVEDALERLSQLVTQSRPTCDDSPD